MTTTTSSPSTVIAVAEPAFTNAERLALAGFLAGYTGLTREAYALDLRQYASWCQQHHVRAERAGWQDRGCGRHTEAARRLVLADQAKRNQVADRLVGAAGAERREQAAGC
jgi:hypothetical protein